MRRRTLRSLTRSALLACVLCSCAGLPSEELPSFSAEEEALLFTLSPLPAPPKDSTNAVDGNPAAIALGAALFFDKRLSGSGEFSCASCHDPAKSWTDGKTLPVAAEVGTRNTQSLWNAAFQRWYFWDGRADSLWSQALHPIEDAREMRSSRLQLAHLIHGDPALRDAFESLFGPLPDLSDTRRFPSFGSPRSMDADGQLNWWRMQAADRELVNLLFANVGKAIAAFTATIVSTETAFDRFVADLRAGRKRSTAMSPAAQRGLKTFIGKGNCVICHSGPLFSNKEFHDIRVRPLAADLPPDAGRARGIQELASNEFVSAGYFSDDPLGDRSAHLRFLDAQAAVLGHFRTPSLRNVALTAPYMHQGQFATLRDAVAYYSTLEGAVDPADPNHVEALIEPLNLTDDEIDELVAFLEALTSDALLE